MSVNRRSGSGRTRSVPVSQFMGPPLRDPRFWSVQGAVLGLALVHSWLSAALADSGVAGVPISLNSGLMLFPVIYASLSFGVAGGLPTAMWASVLVIPNWFVRGLTPAHFWIEVTFMITLVVVAVVVGLRVSREEEARTRAEVARDEAELVGLRYRALFEDQPSPVVIASLSGIVSEANSAAQRVFGECARVSSVEDLLGRSVSELLGLQSGRLNLQITEDESATFTFTARRIDAGVGAEPLVQLVLEDVTEQARREHEERQLAGRILAVQEEERRRLARELHDDPLQSLTHLARSLDQLGHELPEGDPSTELLLDSASIALETADSLRKIIQGLRPPVLDDLGLVPALRQLVDQLHHRSGLTVDLVVTGSVHRMSSDVELTAYRVAQEALSNVARHAHATTARVSVEFGKCLCLTVRDDGVGISRDSNTGLRRGTGMGLQGMQERVLMCSGTLVMSGDASHGTTLVVTLPITEESEHCSGSPAKVQGSTA